MLPASRLKRVPLYVLSLAIVGIFLETAGVFSWAATEWHAVSDSLIIAQDGGQKEVWIEVHDVSPGYGAKPLLEIIDALDRHPKAYSRAVLLVIPNHRGVTPLSKYPEFAKLLADLQSRGYLIGVHGYSHPDPLKGREFVVEAEQAKALLNSGLDEFQEAGLDIPSIFAPPGFGASGEAGALLRERFQNVYYFYYIDAKKNILPYTAHEYTWYDFGPGLWKAKLDYGREKGVFRLSVHVGAVNSEENLKFLDDFLTYVERAK